MTCQSGGSPTHATRTHMFEFRNRNYRGANCEHDLFECKNRANNSTERAYQTYIPYNALDPINITLCNPFFFPTTSVWTPDSRSRSVRMIHSFSPPSYILSIMHLVIFPLRRSLTALGSLIRRRSLTALGSLILIVYTKFKIIPVIISSSSIVGIRVIVSIP